jgi:hypothetical protein
MPFQGILKELGKDGSMKTEFGPLQSYLPFADGPKDQAAAVWA